VANSMAMNIVTINSNAETTVAESKKTEESSLALAEQARRLSELSRQFKLKKQHVSASKPS